MSLSGDADHRRSRNQGGVSDVIQGDNTRGDVTKGMTGVGIGRRWLNHRRMVRNRRELARAIDEASTPAMRRELIAMTTAQFPNYLR
jgi:hypothetical protein